MQGADYVNRKQIVLTRFLCDFLKRFANIMERAFVHGLRSRPVLHILEHKMAWCSSALAFFPGSFIWQAGGGHSVTRAILGSFVPFLSLCHAPSSPLKRCFHSQKYDKLKSVKIASEMELKNEMK